MNAKEKAIKSLEGFRLNVMLGLDVGYDVYKDDDMLKAIDIAIEEAKKEMIYDIKKMVNDCIKKGLATEFILLQGIPTIEKHHLSPSAEEEHNSH